MIAPALILAAHGSRHQPEVNEGIRAYVISIRRALEFDGKREGAGGKAFSDVVGAFHEGEPSFAEALDRIDAAQAVVVPVMTSGGYYSQSVLPRELAKARRFREVRVRLTPPIGAHPDVPSLLRRTIERVCAQKGLQPRATSVAVIGHGTPRHRESSRQTYDLVARLRGDPCEDVFAAFLDEPPMMESVLSRACYRHLIVLPMLIGCGPHALEDIPRRIWAGQSPGDDRSSADVFFAPPFGAQPEISRLILDFALSAVDELRPSRATIQHLGQVEGTTAIGP